MRHVLYCLGLLLLAGVARAEYPTPEAAGFHHCALIYEARQRGVAEFTPYVADSGGWLFDAFLFLRYQTSQHVGTSDGPTRKADWLEHLDTWFAPGRDLVALDETIEQVSKRLGAPSPRAVMLSIPYPNPAVKDFGDVDGDGASEDLSTPEGQEAVARWYVAEAKRRFGEAHFRHLSLWGLYWMREAVPDEDAAAVARFAGEIHAAGLRFSWIPWYCAEGWERWRELGFDVAIMQPNYAFLDTHHGTIRRNRLAINAEEARAHGLGVEIEMPMNLGIPGSRRLFREYLRDGAAGRYGYQQAATAYYLNGDSVEQLAAKRDPLYAALAAYVHGATLPEPDLRAAWKVAGRPAPWLSDQRFTPGEPLAAAQATVPAQPLEALDVFLDEPDRHWTGMVTVEGQAAPGKPWQPVGWARRSGINSQNGRYQVVTVPLSRSWHALRVRFQGEGLPTVAELTPQPPTLGTGTAHLAFQASYQVSPAGPAQYGDAGLELTDGVIPETGFSSGQTVGWIGAPSVAVSFDLGAPMEVSRGEVHLQGGGSAAVNWPRSAELLLASNYPPPARGEGLGAPPADYSVIVGGAVEVDRARGADDQDGHLTFAPATPVKTRYATFLFKPEGWLMLSEIRLFSDGRNVLAGKPYRLQPAPTPVRGEGSYPDNGELLTDGVIAQSFGPGATYGWADGEPRTIEVDLGRKCQLGQVVVWSLSGAAAAVYLPATVTLSTSLDGREWHDFGAGARRIVPNDPPTPCPFTWKLEKQPARFLRAVVTPSRGWSMISEIQVDGARR